jgi:hypothetical protein
MRPRPAQAIWIVLLVVAFAGTSAQAHIGPPDERKSATALQRRSDMHSRSTPRSSGSGTPAAAPILDNFEVVSHLDLPGRSPHGDITVFDHGGDIGTFAYVGTCERCGPYEETIGVKIIDITRPRKPQLVAIAPAAHLGTANEDVDVERIGTRVIMAVGVQLNVEGPGGFALYDVTNPSRPRLASFTRTPAGGVHEIDIVARPDGTALALLAVPFVEFEAQWFEGKPGGDFMIVDITDPADPVKLSNWGVLADSSLPGPDGFILTSQFGGTGGFAASYGHSVRVADDGSTAYVSFWDAGVLKFDISDPSTPELLGRTVFPGGPAEDGDAHSLGILDVGGQRYLFQNDEDWSLPDPVVVTSTATGSAEFSAIDEFWMPVLLTDVGSLTGVIFDAGDGCQAEDFAGAEGRIALFDTVDPFYVGLDPRLPDELPCRLGAQIRRAADAGAIAAISNLVGSDDAYPFPFSPPRAVEGVTVPAVQVSGTEPFASAVRAVPGSVSVTLEPTDPTWGFIRVFREATIDTDGDTVFDFAQVGSFSNLPYVSGSVETPPGFWSVHNTELLGDRAYASWYSHGIVALDVSDPTDPELVGLATPSASGKKKPAFGPDKYAVVWGVDIDEGRGLILASDMRSGLWIFRPTGDAAPSPQS